MALQVSNPQSVIEMKHKKRIFSHMTESEKETHRILEYWTPKDRAVWLDLLVKLVRQKICLKYLTDGDLRTVIDAARRTIAKRFSKIPAPHDPDLPECFYWNETQVGEWISQNGYPELKDAFLLNHISGRKLVDVDASALSKMGLNWKHSPIFPDVASKIRHLLGIPRPNMMRAISRIVPLENFLRKRMLNGRTYDLLTFKKFCEKENLPYAYLMATNKNGRIPCTTKLMLYCDDSIISPNASDDSSDANSLVNVPTVEFITRTIQTRNRIIQQIFDELVVNVCNPMHLRKYGLSVDSMSKLLEEGLKDLGMEDNSMYAKERLDFVGQVGKSLVREMMKTAKILKDIELTEKFLGKNISPKEYQDMKLAAEIFLEDVIPIAALLSLGELDLDVIFRGDPHIESFVENIVKESENTTNELVPESEAFIDAVITEAKLRVVGMLYPDLPAHVIKSASGMVKDLLDDLIETAISYPDLTSQSKGGVEKYTTLLNAKCVQMLEEWKKMKIPRHHFTQKEKFNAKGYPILDKLDTEEILEILEKGEITLQNKTKIRNKEFVIQAKQEGQKRQQRDLQVIAEQQTLRRRYSGQLDDQGNFHEFTEQEKFDVRGVPLLERLNSIELEHLITNGTIEVTVGPEKTKKRLNILWVTKAQNEKERRQREEEQARAQLENYHRQFPGVFDETGQYHEFYEHEKLNENQIPIVERLTTDELDILIDLGSFDGVPVTKEEVIELAKIEKHKRQLQDLQAVVAQGTYRRLFPGTVDDLGQYHEFTPEEKVDQDGNPRLSKLRMDELDSIIENGTMDVPDGLKFLTADVIAAARTEKRKRDHNDHFEKTNVHLYRKNFPGHMDTDGIFHEYTLNEKYDGQVLPILERLNIEELSHLIKTGEFNGIKLPQEKLSEIIDRARIEEHERVEQEIKAKIEQERYHMTYPGKIVEGTFIEYSKEEKFNPTNKMPIIERLNNEELAEILKTGHVVTSDGRKLPDKEMVAQAKIEKEKRDQEELQAAIQQKIYHLRPTIMKTRKGQQKNFTLEEKFDALGHPIFERLTDQELETILIDSEEKQRKDSNYEQALTEKQRRGQEAAELVEAQEYLTHVPNLKDFPVRSLDKKGGPELQDYFAQFEKDNLKVDEEVNKREQMKKLISEQMRIETLEAIREMVDRKRLVNKATNTELEQNALPAVASLALFNSFVIDDIANVLGTVDPFDGKVRDQNGTVIGTINSNGILFLNDGNVAGKVGADIEQIGVAKFRALPKEIESMNSNELKDKTPTAILEEGATNGGGEKVLGKWNAHQANVRGGLLMQKGDQWVRQGNYNPTYDAANTRLALQIQMTEGYRPSQVILLDSQSITSLKTDLSSQSQGQVESPEEENEFENFVWKRAEKKKKKKVEPQRKPLTARMLKGEAVDLKIVKKEDFVTIPGSTGKWGVQEPPEDEPEYHDFKPPPPTPTTTTTTAEQTPKIHDMLTKVHTGEAKKLVDTNGATIGEIRKDGQIVGVSGEYVGYVQNNGIIVKADGTPMKDKGVKIIRQNGVVVGEVNDKGKLTLTKDKDRFMIGMIWGDGRIVTLDYVLVGVVTKDGRILGAGGKPIGLFTPTWEILGTDGVPFAYVTSEGKVYRYEVIPQARYIPPPVKLDADEAKKSEAVVLYMKDNNLAAAFEMPPLPDAQSSHNENQLPSISATPKFSEMDDYQRRLVLEAKQKAKQLEMERLQYDLDESHKHTKPKEITPVQTSQNTPVRTPDPKVHSGIDPSSQHDHRVAKMDAEYLKQKQLRRQQMVDNWAHKSAVPVAGTEINLFAADLSDEDKQRVANTAADTIIDDIFKLALTHLLLQAEAGHNTKKIMDCLAEIQTTSDDEHTQAMWQARLSQVGSVLKVFRKMANMLPKKNDRAGVLKMVQHLIQYSKTNLKEKGKEDKAIQHDVKVDVGVTANVSPPIAQPQTQTATPKVATTLKDIKHHHHHHHHHHRQNPDEMQSQVKRLPLTPGQVLLAKGDTPGGHLVKAHHRFPVQNPTN